MYQRNLLAKRGGITLAGTPIDLSRIEAPTFLLSSREDHIAPWKSTYAATRLYAGPVKFVLTASGHMAGVISAPDIAFVAVGQRSMIVAGGRRALCAVLGLFCISADPPVSRRLDLGRVLPRSPGDSKLAVIEDAPGTYVRVRSDD
jgi:polyhydroxyalkanoate synthase